MDDNLLIHIDNRSLNNSETKFGKTIYYLNTSRLNDLINLSVKRKHPKENQSKEFFLLRYIFDNEKNKNKYSIKETNFTAVPKVTGDYINFKIQLYPLEILNFNPNEYNITYIVRLNTDKSKPKKANIVMKPEEQIIREFYNQKLKKGENLLTFDISKVDNSKKIRYIEIIARIRNNDNLEYLSYDLYVIKSNEGLLILIILIIIALIILIIILGLVIAIIIFKRKNQNLLKEVKRITFVEPDKKNDDDSQDGDKSMILI